MINEQRLVAEFMELVRIDSLSRKERMMADAVKGKLSALGLEVTEDGAASIIDGQAGNVIARLPGSIPGAAPILFNAHLDRVVPGESVKPVLQDGIIRSDGTTVLGADDAAGVAAILEALKVLHEKDIPHPEIEVVFTVAEEIGLLGAKALNYGQLRSRSGCVLDSGGPVGTFVTQGPTQFSFKATFKGKAAHAGANPEEGVSAIQAAAIAIAGMRLGRIDNETTANIGIINGGKATNIIPDEVTIRGEARSLTETKLQEQVADMKSRVEEAAAQLGAEVEVVMERAYPTFHASPESPVVGRAIRAARNLGLEPKLSSTGGGSDANIFGGAGIEVVNLAIGLEKVHTTEEFVRVEHLVQAARLVLELMTQDSRKP